MSAVEEWINVWKSHPSDEVHPLDSDFLAAEQERRVKKGRYPLFREAVPTTKEELDDQRTGQLHKRLGAMPYVGHLATAQIYICMLNPVVGWDDYLDLSSEATMRLFSENKRQERSTCFAFEESSRNGWSNYYVKMFGGLLSESPKDKRKEILHWLSSNVAILELVPYYSQNASLILQSDISEKLPTAQLARRAAQSLAKDSSKLFVIRWKAGPQRWGLEGNGTLSACRNGLSRDAKVEIKKKMGKF